MGTSGLRTSNLRIPAGLLLFSALAGAQLRITTSSVPTAAQYQSYSTMLTATGGTPPYTWSVVSSTGASLPEGMILNPATGVVSATQVNGQGGYGVTVKVVDSGSPAPSAATATINFGVTSDSSYGGCQMFPADSIYNQRIDLLPADTTPSHQIPSSYLNSPLHPDFGQGFSPTPTGIPFMRVAANQANTNVNLANSGQIDSNGTYSWPFPAWPNAVIEGTSYGLNGDDHHILILQSSVNNITGPQTGPCTLYETYQSTAVPGMFSSASNTWFMLAGTHYILNSNEIAASTSTLDDGAQDSPGIPILPLLIRYSEVPLGVQHPLRITFPSPTNGWVWPGTGCCGGSGPPQGLLYRLKASVNWQAICPVNTNPQAATVLQALQQYGAYMSDHGSSGFVQGVPDVRWDDNDLGCFKKFHVSDLEVVDNSMLEVSSISGQTKPYVVPATLPNGAVGSAYSATVSAVGGIAAGRRWSVSSGALPPGLLLDASTGAISGTITSSAGSPYSFSIIATDSLSGYSSQARQFSVVVTGSDGTPPSTPTNVSAAAVSSSQVNVSWSASTDNVGVAGYRVFRNGGLAGTVTSLSFSDSGLAASTTYTYTVAAFDAAGNVSGQSSAATATTPVAAVVSAVSVTPNSGSGTGPQVFKAVYSDTSGASDLQVMYLDFGSVGGAPHDCKVAYAQGANALYLFNDANTAALGPITLGGGGSLSNSQCTLFGGATAATPSGNNLTVPFTIQFLAGYGGLKNIFGMAQSYGGAKSANGVFQVLGTWTPATSTPGVVSVSPNSGSGGGPQVFTAVYSDTGGANDLQAVYLDFGSVGFAAHNCIAVYVPGPNSLYLFTDDNSNAVGPIAEGAGGGSISNSQCTLTSGGTPATLSGTNLTVPFNITFKSGYGGKKTIFGLAQTYAAVQSNGGVLTSLGNWEPALTTPSAVSVSPSSGSGFGPTMFSATYSDSGGANDLQVVYLSFGGSFLASHSCNVGYQPGNNQLLLFSDDNSTAATVGENGAGSVSNSQCTLSGGSTAAIISGTSATVPFSITFKAGFTGAKNVFGLAQSYDGTQSTITTLGSWTP